MYRLDTKLAKIRAGNYAKGDFIIADAKDGDMSNPIPGTGPIRDAQGKFQRFRTRAEFLDVITEIVRQDKVDIMLVSASNLELLTESGRLQGQRRQAGVPRQRHQRHLGRAAERLRQARPIAPVSHGGPEGHGRGAVCRTSASTR